MSPDGDKRGEAILLPSAKDETDCMVFILDWEVLRRSMLVEAVRKGAEVEERVSKSLRGREKPIMVIQAVLAGGRV